MTQTATVNYHVHKPERQSFTLDAGGVVGHLIAPELVPTEVTISDNRKRASQAAFEEASVGFVHRPTRVARFEEDQKWREHYDRELTDMLMQEVSAQEVVVFDHTVRVDDPDAIRKPARNVHSDYSEEGAKQRLIDILGPSKAANWSEGHYAFINVWRPVEAPINSAPLGFILPGSVAEEDWIELDLIYPDRTGQIMGLAANPAHEWIYVSRMTPEEALYFNIYDNKGRASIAHSALDMVEDSSIHSVRRSIESRTLVRY